MGSLKAVIFDMDGVLTETSRQHYLAWKHLAKELGFDIGEEINEQIKGISRMESLGIVLKAGGIYEKFSEVEKIALSDKKNVIYQSLIKEFTKENLSKGAIELLVELRSNNIKIALASVSKNAQFLLEAMGIREYFDVIVDPSEIKKGKPAPDIFLMAAYKLGIDVKNCVGIEDAFAGIEAIKAAGMQPVGIGDATLLYNCDRVFNSIAEVDIDILKEALN